MASGTVKQVTFTAREGSALYHLQLELNALIAWVETHTHVTLMTNAPTGLFTAVKQVVNERKLNPDGTTPSNAATARSVRLGRSGFPGAFEYEAVLGFNSLLDILSTHTHTAINVVPSQLASGLADFDNKDTAGVAVAGTPRQLRFAFRQGTDAAEFIQQYNALVTWHNAHTHTAVATVSALTMGTVSKIATYSGRGADGVAVVA